MKFVSIVALALTLCAAHGVPLSVFHRREIPRPPPDATTTSSGAFLGPGLTGVPPSVVKDLQKYGVAKMSRASLASQAKELVHFGRNCCKEPEVLAALQARGSFAEWYSKPPAP